MLRELLDTIDLLDDSNHGVAEFLETLAPGDWEAPADEFSGQKGRTAFVKIVLPGVNKRSTGGEA